MKNVFKILVLFVFVLLFSCEEQGFLTDCQDCVKEEPKQAELEIQLDPPNAQGTTINIYEGNVEDSVLLTSFVARSDKSTYWVQLNKKYAVTATYYLTGLGVYTAVDSATPGVKYNKNQCNDPCYFVYDKIVNLKLKYTK